MDPNIYEVLATCKFDCVVYFKNYADFFIFIFYENLFALYTQTIFTKFNITYIIN